MEICYSGVWGTVCNYGWDEVDANIVCRQLGYGQPGMMIMSHVNRCPYHISWSLLFSYTAIISDVLGVGEGPTLLFNVTCNHTHLNLSQCVHPESIGLHDCISQDKKAGVICPELARFSTAIISPSTMNSSISSTEVYSTTTLVLITVSTLLTYSCSNIFINTANAVTYHIIYSK